MNDKNIGESAPSRLYQLIKVEIFKEELANELMPKVTSKLMNDHRCKCWIDIKKPE